jgi:hypothetical protein
MIGGGNAGGGALIGTVKPNFTTFSTSRSAATKYPEAAWPRWFACLRSQ